uniref:Blue (Type1) copper domain-containing protein n=1 Tax=uncultured marine thaumarchaeote KM3_196_E01 TaxID=1456085 RepID=A0A075GSP1_9ARCH|nr:hypothetical protein [uncultured marine thaumarchaeote KM3_196_E01]
MYFSIFIFLVSVMIIPNAFASHDSDKQWGTISVDIPILELPYTSTDNPQPKKIKIFGTVEEPRSSAYVDMIITEPDGETYPVRIRVSGQGNYENFILICCNAVGKYSVSAEWKGYHIGNVTFDVVAKPKPQTITSPTPTAEPVTVIPDWIKIHAGWWAEGHIDDFTYLLGIQYLIKEGIMVIPPTETIESSGSQEVPEWIKNNAGWWAEGHIDDFTYVSGIQYLVKVGTIKVS